LADEFHETAEADFGGLELIPIPADLDEDLLLALPDRQHGDAAVDQLIFQKRFRNTRSARADENSVKRGVFGPTEASVAETELHVANLQRHQFFPSLVQQRLEAFDGENLSSEFGKDGGVVAAAGADL